MTKRKNFVYRAGRRTVFSTWQSSKMECQYCRKIFLLFTYMAERSEVLFSWQRKKKLAFT